MHILVVNDDGPPSKRLSPYVRPLVNALQEAGHRVSVAVPAISRSWIGKAHIIEAPIKATYVHPDAFHEDGTWADDDPPRTDNDWVVVTNGTPASCTQLGLYNLFTDRGPVDLVVSGPNHGRNASTIYNLSSGTVGGALEAVTCGKRGIALSFGSKEEQPPEVIDAAARLSARLVNHLWNHWDEGVELYNINVPMRADVESRPIRYTRALPNRWSKGSLYAEVPSTGKAADETTSNGEIGASSTPNGGEPRRRERHFRWCTELSDIKKSLAAAEEGTDAHTVLNGYTSVTPLLANFWHPPGFSGEIHLDP
ncbi:hypothetical protein VTN31DRAFT_438 [Thermomyces dupontii]|uniref:uncharacterized protein n=1 Tax=Talaromyces thermophilus TaxID=28565 RepID=UPI0037432264